MANSNANDNTTLSYFMRKREPEIVSYPAPPSFPEGTPDLQFRILTQAEFKSIRKHWITKKAAKNPNGTVIVQNGKVVYEEDFDIDNYTQELIATSLVCPDLKADELRSFYNCVDVNKMPMLVFSSQQEWTYLVNAFDEVHNFKNSSLAETNNEDIEKAKNS